MRMRAALVAIFFAATGILASSNSSEAADDKPYLLEDKGEVRVLRGLEPDKGFEPTTLPAETDTAPAAETQPQAAPESAKAKVNGDAFEKAEGRWVSERERIHGRAQTSTTTFDYYGKMASRPGPVVTFYSADENGKWEGYWVEDSGRHQCDTKNDGSHHWGVVQFQFNEAYNEFEGTWDFCGEGTKYGWKGKRRL